MVTWHRLGESLGPALGGAAARAAGKLGMDERLVRLALPRLIERRGLTVKLAQLASEWEGWLDAPTRDTFRQAFDTVDPLSAREVRRLLEVRLPVHVSRDLDIEPEPVGTGSLGQVHRGSLRGQEVAIKLQYPGVREQVRHDLRKLRSGMRLLEGRLAWAPMLDELADRIAAELDYRQEGVAAGRFNHALRDTGVNSPSPLLWASTDTVLVQTWAEGVPLHRWLQTRPKRALRRKVAHDVVCAVMLPLMRRRLLHGDVSVGNLLVTEGGRLSVVDLGSHRRLSAQAVRLVRGLVCDGGTAGRQAYQDCFEALRCLPRDPTEHTLALVRGVERWFSGSGEGPVLHRADTSGWPGQGRDRILSILGDPGFSAAPEFLLLFRTFHGLFSVLESLGESVDRPASCPED